MSGALQRRAIAELVATGAALFAAGIRPTDVGGFIVAQVAGGAAGAVLLRWLFSSPRSTEQ